MKIKDSLEVSGKVTMPRAIVNGIQILPIKSFVDGTDHSWSISPEGDVTLTLNLPAPPEVPVKSFVDGTDHSWHVSPEGAVTLTLDIDFPEAPDVLYTNPAQSTVTVGGIPAGSTFDSKTMQQMWTQLLYQELFPDLTSPSSYPSSTFSLTQAGLQEIGATLTLNFGATFNRGTISPAYGTSGFRSGPSNTFNYTGTGLSNKALVALSDSNTVSSYVVTAGAQNWTGSVSYDAGEQPLSNFGNSYSSPLAAGTTGTITRTITGVLPAYATTSSITVLNKQTLVANGTAIVVNLVAESGTDKQIVEIPNLWGTTTVLEQFNTLNNTYEAISLASFALANITKSINGITQDYRQYTHNGATIGARRLRWRVS